MTDTNRNVTLKYILCIWYSVRFYRKNNKGKDKDVMALMNLDNEVNAMYLRLRHKIRSPY